MYKEHHNQVQNQKYHVLEEEEDNLGVDNLVDNLRVDKVEVELQLRPVFGLMRHYKQHHIYDHNQKYYGLKEEDNLADNSFYKI